MPPDADLGVCVFPKRELGDGNPVTGDICSLPSTPSRPRLIGPLDFRDPIQRPPRPNHSGPIAPLLVLS